ncbi:hypothetical protein [Bradyrhizobium brasilense]|uniref:Uncharacterized protein n=1 Tax=Bradyrhizobium brasilense TaxID=1419277 RepID=A0ABY8J6X5_9BRAD|nr:hypothetical protein [Bradyrhizobium brasilense]WFU61266.1 hypothetical protein QA636_27600 [Bradyrhizobium brasilense]
MSTKEGVQGAIEFTKFVIALDSGLIAFMTGATFLGKLHSTIEIVAAIIVLALLAASLCAGVLVYMAAITMIDDADYNLASSHIRIPGQINVVCFAVGAAGVGVLAVLELFLKNNAA